MKLPLYSLFLGLAIALDISAQPILYHEALDRKAQAAQTAARQITNGALFDKEIQNQQELSKLEIERVVSFARVQFGTGVTAFNSWKNVSDQLDQIEGTLTSPGVTSAAAAAQQIQQVSDKIDEVKKSIGKLQAASTGEPPVLLEIQANLKTASDVLDYVKQLPVGNAGFSAAVGHIKAGLDTVKTIYDSFEGIFAARKNAATAVANLNTPVEAEELRLLRLEALHFQWIAQNAAREELEGESVLQLVREAKNALAKRKDSTESIETTIQGLADSAGKGSAADRGELELLLFGLYTAAAAGSQGALPADLARLRETQEEWRYSIIRSAARVGASQELIQSATARLALYYQGGIKPAQVAQLLYNLSGLVSLPIIATK